MPGRTYMGIDYRPDHSFRLPRPDLTLAMGTPNACDRCHVDQTTQWSVDAMGKWYGKQSRRHYGEVLHAGRERRPEAAADLAALSGDRLYPTIVRATALAHLAGYGQSMAASAYTAALADEEALIRQSAVRHLPISHPGQRLAALTPMLYDPVRAVRSEAAAALAALPRDNLAADARQQFDTALAEYRQAMQRTADFSPSRHNLGNLSANLGQLDAAEKHYRQAIAIDGQFYPAKVNLAMLYNRQGKKEDAERLLREVIDANPGFLEIKYSLGLLLVEQNRLQEAVVLLGDASAGLPQRSRIHYNLGLLLQKMRRDTDAEAAMLKALTVEPQNPDYLYALAVFYMQRTMWDQARKMAERMLAAHPDIPVGKELLNTIDQNKDP
jgi:Tfp pilus assembly protein PilF